MLWLSLFYDRFNMGPRTWERRLAAAKAKHRPKLKNWSKDLFGRTGSAPSLAFQQLRAECGTCGPTSIARVDASELTVDEFFSTYEAKSVPVLVANTKTTSARLESFSHLRNAYGSRLFKVGEDDDGYKVKVKLKYFLKYLAASSQGDDSPLYVFDSTFDDDEVSKALLEDYSVPKYFPDDLFSLVGERRRPPYRWFLVGPERSGTCVHTDPLGTSAWNTVIRGRKRWVLFPPETPRSIAKALDVIRSGEDDEAINYFVTFLPRLRELQKQQRQQGKPTFTMIEFTQFAGETVFVPGGWWHAVLNLDDSIAVTQNFCSRNNFQAVWRATRAGRKKMAVSWLNRLRQSWPALAEDADRINAEDGWTVEGKKMVEIGPRSPPPPPAVHAATSTPVPPPAPAPAPAPDAEARRSQKHLSKRQEKHARKRQREQQKQRDRDRGAESGETSGDSASQRIQDTPHRKNSKKSKKSH